MDLSLSFESKKWSAKSIHEHYELEQSISIKKDKPPRTVFRISRDAVVKRIKNESEITVMKLALDQGQIPTPRVLSQFNHGRFSYAVLEYIEGETVAEAWASMSEERKQIVLETLERYVLKLRDVKDGHSSTPGPLGQSPMVYDAVQFGRSGRGPFGNFAELTYFLNEMLSLTKQAHPSVGLKQFNEDLPLVLTHNDLNMTNIMIDKDEKIWLIDWEMSGYYPQYFEQFAMMHTMPKVKKPEDWVVGIPKVTGDHPKEIEKLWAIQEALNSK
ncbi:kinase-like protein [Rickenella mellea]|uniref:Kinase-like protein n=1 Tax=Rickenella mellea TaxID=50990 RepID=A0A4Y7PQN8_9AGAM|nr:kinase-like protein [Rickenella mellea]